MGVIFSIAKVVGSGMASIGGSIVSEGIIMEAGSKYCKTKFGKACVTCCAWGVGTYAAEKSAELFYNAASDVEEGLHKAGEHFFGPKYATVSVPDQKNEDNSEEDVENEDVEEVTNA